MTKLATFTLTAAVAGFALAAQAHIAVTNIVQNFNFQLTILEQGPTNQPSAHLTVVSLKKAQVGTRDVIAALGTATGNNFSPTARLVRLKRVDPTNQVVAFQVRDGANAPVDVTPLFSGSYTESPIRSFTYNSQTGIGTGVSFGVLHLLLTNTPPFNLTGSLNVAGALVSRHASIRSGTTVLGVDDDTAHVVGSGTDTNGTPALVSGTINITGRTVEVQ